MHYGTPPAASVDPAVTALAAHTAVGCASGYAAVIRACSTGTAHR